MIDALRGTRRRRVAALAALLATTAACAASPVAKVDTTAELAATRPVDELLSVGAAAHAFVALDRTREKAMVAALSAPGATGAPVDLRELLASRATTRACAGASGAGECYAARGLTLEPGDIIATGTPPGVGYSRKPPEFLKPGDVMETEIVGVGVIRNTIETES